MRVGLFLTWASQNQKGLSMISQITQIKDKNLRNL